MKDAGVPDYKALLTEAIDIIFGLAHLGRPLAGPSEAALERFIDAVNTPTSFGGLPVGPGWRLVNSDCIEVDGVRYVFYYRNHEVGHISRDPIGRDHIEANGGGPQELADRIRAALAEAEICGDGPDDIDAEAAMEGSAFT